ncbi:MAG TPA: hypothetical protein VEM95_05650, partial [Thermoplasmata archaeon]|nr:hypothetical protein [Thermoplasmata archaeon]
MPPETRAILETFSARELKALAADLGVDAGSARSKTDLLKRLVGSEKVVAALEAPAYRLRPILAAKDVASLQRLAAELSVDVKGVEKKADYVARIVASPAAVTLLGPPPEAKVTKAAPPPPEPPRADLAYASADHLIQQGRNQDVDFGLVEDVLDQARMRFEERNFDRTLELAREALLLGHGTLDAFERSAWAYALLSAQRLIEESGRIGRDTEPAAVLLRDAKVAYASGNLGANQDLLMKLQAATKALYSEEVRHLRQAIYVAQERIGQTAHIGADVTPAEEALARARDAM